MILVCCDAKERLEKAIKWIESAGMTRNGIAHTYDLNSAIDEIKLVLESINRSKAVAGGKSGAEEP